LCALRVAALIGAGFLFGCGGPSAASDVPVEIEEWTDPPAYPVQTGEYLGNSREPEDQPVRIVVTRRESRPDDFVLANGTPTIVHANVYIKNVQMNCTRTFEDDRPTEVFPWDPQPIADHEYYGYADPEEGQPLTFDFGNGWVREDMESQFAVDKAEDPFAFSEIDKREAPEYDLYTRVGGSFLKGDKAQGWFSVEGEFGDNDHTYSDSCETGRKHWWAKLEG